MAKSQPIASVYVDIARLSRIVSNVPKEKRGEWLDSLVDSLCFRDSSLNEYGAFLISESEEYRRHERDRKKKYSEDSTERQEIHGKTGNPRIPPTDRQTDRQTDINKRERGSAPAPSIFFPPSFDDVKTYCEKRGNRIDPQTFLAKYAATGWKNEKGVSIVDWRAQVVLWEKRSRAGRNHGS